MSSPRYFPPFAITLTSTCVGVPLIILLLSECPRMNFSNQTSAQKVERGLRRARANQVAVAGDHQAAVLGVRVVGQRDEDEADGLLLGAAAGSCDARNRSEEHTS